MTTNPYWLNHNTRKLDPEDVILIRELREEGLTMQAIADKFEVSKTHVSKIVNGKVWGHLRKSAEVCGS
jgi:transcriptional regulator with XRE-family HTH domain